MEAIYLRLGLHIWEPDTAVIRAASRIFAPHVRRNPARRSNRKAFYRSMLERHHDHQALARHFRL